MDGSEIVARRGECLTCGCRVLVARYMSLAKVLERLDEMRCPQCGSVLAVTAGQPEDLFVRKMLHKEEIVY